MILGVRLVPFDQEAAVKADWQGCLSSIVLHFLVVVLRKLEGQMGCGLKPLCFRPPRQVMQVG